MTRILKYVQFDEGPEMKNRWFLIQSAYCWLQFNSFTTFESAVKPVSLSGINRLKNPLWFNVYGEKPFVFGLYESAFASPQTHFQSL